MFSNQFYPTPLNIIEIMTQGMNLEGKTILEPSAGKGDIVDFCAGSGAFIIACENNKDLQKILATKCKIIADDFLTVSSDQISHIDAIIMNPPFNDAAAHILHAYAIAPKGCKIIALCNSQTVQNTYTQQRKELKSILDSFGNVQDLKNCFADAERQTDVNTSLLTIQKAGENYKSEFEGFFTDEEPEEVQGNGVLSYNVVRDLVNRYVAAIKLYDGQLELAAQMNELTHDYFFSNEPKVTMTINRLTVPLKRNDFKKDMQKAGWKFIFSKMDMNKYSTRGLREDINKFVEQQTEIPFTMRNIYKMLQIVVGTAGQRMDKAILEVFDRITERHHENRCNVKGWKTNSHFLVGKKFILDYMINPAKEYGYTSSSYRSLKNSFDGLIPDFEKALCFITGVDYKILDAWKDEGNRSKDKKTVGRSISDNLYGEWYNSYFFKYKGYKNGNMHFEFIDEKVWTEFNARVAKLKGYPLFEGKDQTEYQKRNTGRSAA